MTKQFSEIPDDDLYEELESHLAINKYDLDSELDKQADIFHIISKQVAEKESKRDYYKNFLQQEKARVYLQLRSDTSVKFTEAQLAHELELHIDVLKANKLLQSAKLKADLWLALKDAFSQRSFMLMEMCGLYATGYFSDIVIKKSQADSADQTVKNLRDRLALKRRLHE